MIWKIMTRDFNRYFRLRNFDSAAVFKTVTEDDIKYVEQFIRNELHEMLVAKFRENDAEYDDTCNTMFYGNYSSIRQKFEFSRGDVRVVTISVDHVKSKVCDENGDIVNLDHFKGTKRSLFGWQKKLFDTPGGLFFPADIVSKIQKAIPKNYDNYKTALLAKCKQVFEGAEYKSLKIARESDEDNIAAVEIDDNGSVKGTVNCIFCESEDQGKVKLYFQPTTKFGFWVPSNLTKHIAIHHNVSIEKKRKPKIKDENELTLKRQKTQEKKGTQPKILREKINNKIPKPQERGSLLKLEIEHTTEPDVHAISDVLYKQISTQNIEMMNTTICNSEKAANFYMQFDMTANEVTKEVKICRIKSDGNCLFGSIVHQLYHAQIDSPKHDELVSELRQKVVEHIKLNIDAFIPSLTVRLYEENDRKKGMNKKSKYKVTKDDCVTFLDLDLPQSNFWGGGETLKAVSAMNEVNIVVIRDSGKCNMATPYNSEFGRSIVIAYRNGNHYDSVSSMSEILIHEYANNLAKQHQKYVQNIKNNNNMENSSEVLVLEVLD